MRIPGLRLSDLVDVYEDYDPLHDYFLNVETGEVIFTSEFDPSQFAEVKEEIEEGFGETFIRLPRTDSDEGYRDMVEFAESIDSRLLRNRLERALDGRQPFRRFKDVLLDFPDERERWFTFQRACNQERVREWLAENDIETDTEADIE